MAEDYKEEQVSEVDALVSIYGDEIQVIEDDPYCLQIKINETVGQESSENEEETSVSAMLQFTLKDQYPNNIPEIDILEDENVPDNEREELKRVLVEEAENNIGMVMIFTLVSAAQEFVNALHDKLKEQELERKELAKKKEQEEHEKKFHGTPVTVETFTAWRIQFEEEFRGMKPKIEEDTKGPPKRLTGRQLFETDSTLNDSDAQFFADGGVEVDESLFQEMGDLDLEEDFD